MLRRPRGRGARAAGLPAAAAAAAWAAGLRGAAGAAQGGGGLCNVSGELVSIPCRYPRCRHSMDTGRNRTERGLEYHRSLIDRFFSEWDDYQGFLGLETAFLVHALSMIQSDMGHFGAVGEIGVAAGSAARPPCRGDHKGGGQAPVSSRACPSTG
ncbi:unnamed protein product [Prorocentrum cordatum]|uniref:Uncharacterized protein n=1 Tax=Prorocentrum cordatum TaxID=2364126 RepID=A0ABN9QGX0_9DINO|nr:unnamed protein product [Polarella glacialis]